MIHLLWCIINFTDLHKYSDKELKHFHTRNPICGTFCCVLEMSSLPIILDTKKLGCRDENILPETPSPPPIGMGCDATLV